MDGTTRSKPLLFRYVKISVGFYTIVMGSYDLKVISVVMCSHNLGMAHSWDRIGSLVVMIGF